METFGQGGRSVADRVLERVSQRKFARFPARLPSPLPPLPLLTRERGGHDDRGAKRIMD